MTTCLSAGYTFSMALSDLHAAVARELGWDLDEVKLYSLPSLLRALGDSNPELSAELRRHVKKRPASPRGRRAARPTDPAITWYHGGPRILDWNDVRWDRDRTTSDLNAEGPGMYFTTDAEEAAGYMGPSGVVLKAHMRPGFRLPPGGKPLLAELLALYDEADAEDQATFLSNWLVEYPAGRGQVRSVLARYARQETFMGAAVTLYGDLFRHDGEAFVKAMRALEYDGFVVTRGDSGGSRARSHLVLWNPSAMTFEELE